MARRFANCGGLVPSMYTDVIPEQSSMFKLGILKVAATYNCSVCRASFHRQNQVIMQLGWSSHVAALVALRPRPLLMQSGVVIRDSGTGSHSASRRSGQMTI